MAALAYLVLMLFGLQPAFAGAKALKTNDMVCTVLDIEYRAETQTHGIIEASVYDKLGDGSKVTYRWTYAPGHSRNQITIQHYIWEYVAITAHAMHLAPDNNATFLQLHPKEFGGKTHYTRRGDVSGVKGLYVVIEKSDAAPCPTETN